MSTRNLESLLQPGSVALIGASTKPQGVGATVMRNLLAGGFTGAVYPVNPKYDEVAGVKAYSRVADLPAAPDLAVICTPPPTVPGLVRGTGTSSGRRPPRSSPRDSNPQTRIDGGRNLTRAMLDAARPAPSCGSGTELRRVAGSPGSG